LCVNTTTPDHCFSARDDLLPIALRYSAIVQLLGFLLLGLGIDDAFVIVQSYQQTRSDGNAAHRIGSALRVSGTSITVTSVSDMVAFLSCLGNSLPVIQAVCAFGALGVLFDYAFQVSP
jgi:predicted RND superfamily exporter protein